MSTKQKTMKKFRVILVNGIDLVYTCAQDLVKEYDKLTDLIFNDEIEAKYAELRLGAGGSDDFGFINYLLIASICDLSRFNKNHELFMKENDLSKEESKIIQPPGQGLVISR